ncbi:hypothetical protein [Gemmatimonas sp.]|uniref:hypothetical protein n=1 Tax=Gemmatimonas sp. TaxID=1962908 RepID=UPI003DA44973
MITGPGLLLHQSRDDSAGVGACGDGLLQGVAYALAIGGLEPSHGAECVAGAGEVHRIDDEVAHERAECVAYAAVAPAERGVLRRAGIDEFADVGHAAHGPLGHEAVPALHVYGERGEAGGGDGAEAIGDDGFAVLQQHDVGVPALQVLSDTLRDRVAKIGVVL